MKTTFDNANGAAGIEAASEPVFQAALQARSSSAVIEVLTEILYRRTLIAKVAGVFLLFGGLLCFLLPPRYTATTRIMPPQQTQSAASIMMNQIAATGAGSLASLASGGLGLKNPNDIYVGLLDSRPVADAIIQQYGMQAAYHARDMTAARKELAAFTAVMSEKNGFIAVSVTDRDKARSAAIANAYIDQLRELTRSLAVTEAARRRFFYQEQLKEARSALVAAEASFQAVQQSKGLVALDAQAKAMIEGVAQLRARVGAKKVELDALRSYSTDHNPEVVLAERELGSLREEVDALERRSQASGGANLGIGDMPGSGLDYLRAEHEVKYRQGIFDLLMKQFDAAKLDESREAAIIQVIEPAIAPDRRSSPPRGLILLLAAIFGVLCGCMAALAQYWLKLAAADEYLGPQLNGLKCAFSGTGPGQSARSAL